ncbi:efflux transporter outer membrane subunit [Massilia sp. 9096]|uniref:efflux transporter outer membrane subunit n=1 Tax=Massilia sp. 9096 TaxID=1500894 RepID=UPI00069226C8|nr:efflux transporter outer membrane subunit [Massilia sp. 9096]
MTRPNTRPLLLCALVAAALAGCTTVGKNYAGAPAAPQSQGGAFARAGDAALPGQTVSQTPSNWWSALNDPELDSLEQRALHANPSLDRARARLRQARAALREESANNLPNGSANATAAHVRFPKNSPLSGGSSSQASGAQSGEAGAAAGGAGGAGGGLQLPSSLNLYNVGFDATWEIDLFGGTRRAVEAARASAQAAEAGIADAQVSLAAEVALAYTNLRSAQQRLALSEGAVIRQQRMVDLTAARAERGTASQLDLTRIQAQLESTRADREPLLAQVDIYRDELATLIGLAPGALDAELDRKPQAGSSDAGAVPLPPNQVATGDPAALLRRRPDIRAAERQLAASNARIGQAEAAKFPRLTLLGVIGIGGTRPSDLTHLDNFSAIGAPQLSWNVLDFGRNAARVEQAEGARDEADAQYRQAVLQALRDAEDSLARFRQGRVTVATAARAKALADKATYLMQARQQAGTATLIDVLDTERQQIAAEQNLAQAQAALTSGFIGLQKALGLGWEDAGAGAAPGAP